MGLDEELDKIEDGAETEAEQIDEKTELEDVEEFQDDELFDPQAEESDLEEAYEGFFAEEGPEGEGETSPEGYDGGLAAVVANKTGMDLSEEGFHIVGDDGNELEDELAEEGMLDEYDGDELAEDDENATIDEPVDENDDYEVVELELDDDDIVAYLEDEDGNRVGFVVMEDGEEVEYFYVEGDDGVVEDGSTDNEFDMGITKEGVARATNDVNAIYKDGIAVVSELKDAVFDIKEAFDFGFLKKK